MKLWSMNQIPGEEKADILAKHRHIYNGYQAMQPKVENTMPLYVQDFAKDKGGMVMNNKGDVKEYTNFGINESVEESMCSECGGMMYEGECSECGMKGYSNEEMDENIYDVRDINNKNEFDYTEEEMEEQDVSGVQGIYADMKPAYDFDSGGPDIGSPFGGFGEEIDEDDEELDEFWQGAAAAGLTAAAVPIGNAIGNKVAGWINDETIDEDLMESVNHEKMKISSMIKRMKSFN
jgi:hypothetical protein